MLTVLAGAQAPFAQADAGRQTASLRLTTTEPGAPTGSNFSVDFHNPTDPGGKPYAIARIVIELHPGSVIDTSAPERCRASDVKLLARGPAACPAASRVGGGLIISDTGASGGPLPRFVENDVDNFNNRGELITVADARNSPVIPGLTRVVGRSPIRGATTTADFPLFPGNPPPDPFTAIKVIRLSSDPIIRGGRAYTRTPPSCPRSRRWTTTLTFIYRDGATQQVLAHSPCRRSRTAGDSGGEPSDGGQSSTGNEGRDAHDSDEASAGTSGRDSRGAGDDADHPSAAEGPSGALPSTGTSLSLVVLSSALLASGGLMLEALARRP